jgi:hypothetical protein
VEVDVEDGEHEAKVASNGCLAREKRLHALLDPHVPVVDVVVERDHLVGELVVALLQCIERAAQSAKHE